MMKELLETYYNGFAWKSGWSSVLSDDFTFVGGDITMTTRIVAGDRACLLANYHYVFPKSEEINGDVAELWNARNGTLDSLTIFFDTHTFHLLTKP